MGCRGSKPPGKVEPEEPPPPEVEVTETPPSAKRTARIKWRKGDLIGMGANGRVYLGLEEDTGAIIAVKEILFGTNADREELEQMQEEIELLRTLSHPNIVTYLGTDVSDDGQTLFIFTEWVPGGSIQALVTKFGRLPEAIVRKYVAQLLVGLTYLHERQVIHRDIKAANILVDDRGNIKLADFGSSKRMESQNNSQPPRDDTKNHSLRGTPYFMAPEVITQSGYGRKADIWSVGCTILQMVTGQPPWKSLQCATPAALMFHIANASDPPPMPDTLTPDLRAMLLSCFQRDVEKRPSAAQLLQHPFVQANNAAVDAIDIAKIGPRIAETTKAAPVVVVVPEEAPESVVLVVPEQKVVVTTERISSTTAADEEPALPPSTNQDHDDNESSLDLPHGLSDEPPSRPVEDEAMITMFLSREAATQFAGADKHFPGRPPTARPRGAPPRTERKRRPRPEDESRRRPPREYRRSSRVEQTPTRPRLPPSPELPSERSLKIVGGSRTNVVAANPHDEKPIVTEAAMREQAAILQNKKNEAQLLEQRVRQNEQFAAELSRFKEHMQATGGNSNVVSTHHRQRRTSL